MYLFYEYILEVYIKCQLITIKKRVEEIISGKRKTEKADYFQQNGQFANSLGFMLYPNNQVGYGAVREGFLAGVECMVDG